VVRTRTALYEALVHLIRRKAYDQITVEDIISEAGIGRATFYAHFTSKDDLLERSLDRLRDLFVSEDNSDTGRQPVRILFDHVAEYRDIPIALSGGKGSAIIRQAMDRVLTNRLRATLWNSLPADLPRDLFIRHVVACSDTVLSWWLEREPHRTPGEAYTLFRQLMIGVTSGDPEGWSDHL
jgi:AcrR family transcriptional regulator